MRTRGSASQLQELREKAVLAVKEGKTPAVVAEVLRVHPASVRKWWNAYLQHGIQGIASKPHPGRPSRLTAKQQARVLGWIRKNPKSFGFSTELWTARRLAEVIQRKLNIEYHPRYLNEWLTARGITPQKPQKRARERDDPLIKHWVRHRWPCIQNEHAA
ncbi:MAG: winged helix-turn-helix domain-containing protein [Gemmataceae bacterium]|nr:winged helix-turn-helix domain-containing protein [Gemmataceae bacterium]